MYLYKLGEIFLQIYNEYISIFLKPGQGYPHKRSGTKKGRKRRKRGRADRGTMLSEIRGWARIDVSRSGKAWRGSAALSIQYDREITFRGCQISGLNWISSNAPIPRLWRALHSRRNEFWIAWNPVRSSIRPRNTEEDSRPEVEEQWRGKTATFLFLFFSRNQSGWRELSRDDRSGKSWLNGGNRAKRIEKSFSFFGIEECCFDKKYFKPSFFSSLGWSNVCVYIKIFWLKWNFRFLDISWLV